MKRSEDKDVENERGRRRLMYDEGKRGEYNGECEKKKKSTD